MQTITTISLAVRILISLFTRTFFQPDEYFQSLEPAHHAVFGYGHLTWEWMTMNPIRSILYPAINIPVYWVLKLTGLDRFDVLIIACPKVLHGVLAAGADIGLSELSRVVLGKDYVGTAVLLSLTSLFNALALSRSLSNSLETSLSTLAFAYYPWDASSNLSHQVMFNRTKIRKTLLFSALACIVRPTNAIIWIFLYGKLLWSLHRHSKLVVFFLRDTILVVLGALSTLFVVDSVYYGKPTFAPTNFLLANLSSVSLFYGASPWHYYISQGLPILCTTALPFTLHGIYSVLKSKNTPRRKVGLETMVATVMWSIGVYSLAGHKEWRFLHPILPLLLVFAAKSLVDLGSSPFVLRTSSKEHTASKPRILEVKRPRHTTRVSTYNGTLPIRKTHLLFLLVTVPASLYVVLFYGSAPISVLSYIRSLPLQSNDARPFTDTIGFLMPCHSTPGYAYLHRKVLADVPGRMWALGCEPPLGVQNLSSYQDQTDIFFSSPKAYLKERFPSDVNLTFPPSPFPSSHPGQGGIQDWRHEWPKHLIMFGHLLRKETGVRKILEEKGYREVWKSGRAWEGEGERKGGVRVWRFEESL